MVALYVSYHDEHVLSGWRTHRSAVAICGIHLNHDWSFASGDINIIILMVYHRRRRRRQHPHPFTVAICHPVPSKLETISYLICPRFEHSIRPNAIALIGCNQDFNMVRRTDLFHN